jgi:hypothetical protein
LLEEALGQLLKKAWELVGKPISKESSQVREERLMTNQFGEVVDDVSQEGLLALIKQYR